MDITNYWPKSLIHHSQPIKSQDAKYIQIAEINDSDCNGYKGAFRLTTALVPITEMNEILSINGGIGSEVESWGPQPCVDKDVEYNTYFWIKGAKGTDDKYQTIVNSWLFHDKQVLMLDNVFLMAYGLMPRYLDNGITVWDDPSKPEYEVVRMKSLADFNVPEKKKKAYIEIRKDYFEDYLSLKNCAAVSVFYEERWSNDDMSLDSKLKDHSHGIEYDLPGRKLLLTKFDNSEFKQFVRVWGSKLLLNPISSPIYDDPHPLLTWPDFDDHYPKYGRGMHMDYCYIKDSVLRFYENKDEYQINSITGGLSKDTWWEVSYIRRCSRNFLCLELRKLYEGCPSKVIKHWHRFAVSKTIAENDIKIYGEKHIGIRVEEFVNAYLELTDSLAFLSHHLEIPQNQVDIGSFDTKNVQRHGWWTYNDFKALSDVFTVNSSKSDFLSRVLKILKLLENIKGKTIRKILLEIGLSSSDIKGLRTFKLLGTLVQLFKISDDEGLSIYDDAEEIIEKWDNKTQITILNSLFALNELRQFEAHSKKDNAKFVELLKVFGIDIESTKSGWGISLDLVLEKIAQDFNSIGSLIESVTYS